MAYACPVHHGSDQSVIPPRFVSVRDLLADADLEEHVSVRAGQQGMDRAVTHARIQKSGLVLAGHVRGIVPTRVQILGETELTFLAGLDPATRRARIDGFIALGLSLVVVTRGVEPPPDLLDAATRTGTPLVVASPRSSTTINAIHAVLDRLLAPEQTVHGVLVEVHGLGTLLLGPSGIGKSECALFLVERGHRLIADDRVIITELVTGRVVGRPPPLLRHHLEVRGLGILDIRDLFGATAVRDDKAIDLVVELCPWRDDDDFDRLGLEDLSHAILGVTVPKLRIPVRPGRDMAVILEVAARNQLLKSAGRHAARDFARNLARSLGLPDPTVE